MTLDDIDAREKAQALARDKAKHEARLERDDITWLMSGKRGRRIVKRLLVASGVWRLSFNTNAMTTAFNEGMRNQGLTLTAQLMNVCPAQYAEMITENQDD